MAFTLGVNSMIFRVCSICLSDSYDLVNTLFSEIEVRDSRIPILLKQYTMSKGERSGVRMCAEWE